MTLERRLKARGKPRPTDMAPLLVWLGLTVVAVVDADEPVPLEGEEEDVEGGVTPCARSLKAAKVSLVVGLTANTIPCPQCPVCLQKNHHGPSPSGTVQFFTVGLLELDTETLDNEE